MAKQSRIGIVGGMAVGKSHVAKCLVEEARACGAKATHLNVDVMLRDLYEEDSPGAQEVRDRLAAEFKDKLVLSPDRKSVNRALLAHIIFASGATKNRDFVVKLTMPHVHRLYRQALNKLEGLVVVEWAQLAEMGMSAWTNHNVIVVDSPDRQKLAKARDITSDHLEEMSKFQLNAEQKCELLEDCIRRDKSGKVLRYNNRFGFDAEADIAKLYKDVTKMFLEPKLFT